MEPSGRNRWQPLANGAAAKTAQIGEKRCRGLRPVAAGMHRKEGVGGSSPPEGFVEKKSPEIVIFVVWHSTTEHLRIGVGTPIELAARPRSACKPTCCPAPRSTSLNRRGSMWWPWPGAPEVAGKEDIRDRAAWARILGDRSWGQDEQFGRNPRGLRRPRSERADELEHVVGELPDTVRGGGLLTLNPVSRACVNK